MLLYPSPAVLLYERLDQPPGSFLILNITEHRQQTLLLVHLHHAEVCRHKEGVSIGNISVSGLNIHVVDMPGDGVGPHGLHLRGSGGFRSNGVV